MLEEPHFSDPTLAGANIPHCFGPCGSLLTAVFLSLNLDSERAGFCRQVVSLSCVHVAGVEGDRGRLGHAEFKGTPDDSPACGMVLSHCVEI